MSDYLTCDTATFNNMKYEHVQQFFQQKSAVFLDLVSSLFLLSLSNSCCGEAGLAGL